MKAYVKHALVNILILLLVLEPCTFAMAGGIVVDPKAPAAEKPSLDSARNGVPIVDIASPNAAGISHNLFDRFNVAPKGVIINNSVRSGVSRLGGAIYGNPHFSNGAEARIILNEVTGSSRSNLEGYTEIFGRSAQYILANPNGISVNGGGFINTPRAVLTTGRPLLDSAGGLKSFAVRGGDVLIDGQGVNAANIDAFDIVTRAARINAAVYAKELHIATGRGDYSPLTQSFAAATPDASVRPTVSIDSTALGGMYADRITLIGNEEGVGVNLAGQVQATVRLTLTADGRIALSGSASSDKDASISSGSDSIAISGKLGAAGALDIRAGREVRLASGDGGETPLVYGDSVTLSAGTLTNVDGKLAADATLSATTTADMDNAGTLYAGTDATLDAEGALYNSGRIEAVDTLTAAGRTGIENSGTLQSGGGLTAGSGADFTNSGTVSTQAGLNMNVTGGLNNSGTLSASLTATLAAGSLTNQVSGRIEALGDASLTLGSDSANAGTVNVGGTATLSSTGALSNESTGQMLAQTGIDLTSQADLTNLGTFNSGGSGTYVVAGRLHNAGTLSSSDGTEISAADITNDAAGRILSQGDAGLTVSGDLTNAGLIYSGSGGVFRVGGTLLNNRGQFLSQDDMLLEGPTDGGRMTKLENDSGGIESLSGGLTLRSETVTNENLDFAVQEGAVSGETLSGGMHSYGNDAQGVPIIYRWATGHGLPAEFKWNAGRIRAWQVRALGLDSTRNVFSRTELIAAADKIEQELAVTPDDTRKASIDSLHNSFASSTSPYFVLILDGQRGEIAVYEAKTTTDTATGQNDGGDIAAANDITIDAGSFSNDVSKVSTASGDITIDAGTFSNTGDTLYQRDTVDWGRGFTNNCHNKGTYSEGHGREVLLTPVGYAYGSINAGGKVTITATHAANGISENSGASTSGASAAITAPVKPESLARTVPDISELIGSLSASSLFTVNTAPGQHYLIATNPALTDMSTFYGSDYFLSRAGIDLTKTNMELLGDAYYETRLVREQIFALTGKRLLSSSATSDAAQMRELMDSALREKQSLNLTVGVALTSDQIAQLTENIVWLVKTEVDGREVLVPKVYLASSGVDAIAEGGSVIVGKDVDVTSTGDVANGGVLLAENTLTLNAANVLNSGGTLGGQTVTVAATDSIANMSGSIAGKDVTLTAGKSIAVGTTATTFSSATTTSEAVGRRGEVAATGSLKMTAGQDINVAGADVSAGGDANLTAGGSVNIAAQTLSNTTDVASSHNNYKSHNANVANLGSTLTSGGALAVTAGQDVAVTGSTVAAGGDAAITAGRNVTIASATDSQEFSRHLEGKDGGFFGGKSSEDASGSSTTNVASKVTSGGGLTVTAGAAGSGDLVVSGSKASATDDVKMTAAGSATIAAAQSTSSSHYESKSSGLGGLLSSSGVKDNQTVTTERSEITAGNDIAVEAQKDVTLQAAKVTSGGATTLAADGGKVSLLTGKNSEYNRSVSSNVGLVTWSSQDKGKNAETIVNTLIQTGKGLTITSRDGVTVEYKQTGDLRQDIQQLSQAQGLEWMGELLKRKDVDWKGVQEKYKTWNKKSGGLSPAATIVLAIAASAATGSLASSWAGSLVQSVGSESLKLALQSALTAGIAATAANVTVAAANAAAGGDFGKNMEALVSEQGVRSLLESMVLASTMGSMDSSLKGKSLWQETQRALVKSVVQTLTSNVVGGKDIEKSFLTALGSSFDSYVLGEIGTETRLERTERLVLAGALGAAGAKLTGGDPYQAALSAMTVEAADWIKASPLTEEQRKAGAARAALSQCSYNDKCMQQNGYERVSDERLKKEFLISPSKLVDPETGLHAYVFEKQGEIVLAIRGTATLSDVLTDIKQALFGVSDQYSTLAKDKQTLWLLGMYAKDHDSNLVVTGHSLGGGIATLLASTGFFSKAIVFNPAGVSDSLYKSVGGNKSTAEAITTSYTSRGDILTMLQDAIPFLIPKAIGKRVVIEGAGMHSIDPIVSTLNNN